MPLKQVWQSLPLRMPLAEGQYRNPYSSKKTDGLTNVANNLFDLVDPICGLATEYSGSAASFARTYRRILDCISPSSSNISQLKKKYEETYLYTMHFEYPLIESTPYDWYATASMYARVKVGPPTSKDATFIKIGANKDESIEFEGFMVRIIRPWFDFSLFNMNWCVEGYDEGSISPGAYTYEGDDPIMPLVPSSLVIEKDNDGLYLKAVISTVLPKTPKKSMNIALPLAVASKVQAGMMRKMPNTMQLQLQNKPLRPVLLVDKFNNPV
ncbi:MAG: hypothetical protein LBU89_08495 [Fibromonadaceae bacterium]|jgi:hypothetical protein|nr:hypothetical protein [Fibromonadaceae bacterium]